MASSNLVYFFGVLLIFDFTLGSPLFELSQNISYLDNISQNVKEINYRLPNNTIPLEYNIEIVTNIHKNQFDFNGFVEIKIKVKESNKNSKIVVHARQLRDFHVELYKLNEVNSLPNIKSSYDEETEFLTIYSEKNLELKNGDEYLVKISYKGTLREDNGGFYRSSYLKPNGDRIYLATTQFESTDARHGFPCYDEPGIKAPFTISITHGKKYTAISNMPEDTDRSQDISRTDLRKTVFKKTPPMSTYLVAFVVSDFIHTTQTNEDGRMESVYSRPGSEDEQYFALDTSVKILRSFEKYLGIKYPLEKMYQIAVPDFAAGAMENWGLVTYREEYLLYNPKKSTIFTRTHVATIIAHEYAHQWFGNLVSPAWWTYTWLNEGFATLFSYIGTDKVYPDWNIMEDFIISDYQRALLTDVGATARPMTHYAQKPKDIAGLFDGISYSKAGSVLRMMQHVLSEKVFTKGLNYYLNSKKAQSAKEDDLFEGLQKAVDEDNIELPASVKDIMKSWTNQAGFPLLTVKRNYDDGSFTISQEKFQNEPDIKDDKTRWYVPYNYVTGNNRNFDKTQFDGFLKKDDSITIKPKNDRVLNKNDWLLLNVQQTGYYRVNYDLENWRYLTQALKKNSSQIHVNNRAQLINDAFRLVIAKRLKVNTLLELLMYLDNENRYSPWASANAVLNTFNLFMRGYDDEVHFNMFIERLVLKLYKSLGLEDLSNENRLTKSTRVLAIKWACEARIEECLQNTNKRLREFVINGTEIEPNLQEVIYCYGLKKGTKEEFEYLHKRLFKSIDAAERQLLINSLGCSDDPALLKSFFKSSISENHENTLRPQERIILLRSAYSRSHVGVSTAIDFLSQNYKKYSELTPGFIKKNPLIDDIVRISNLVVTADQKTNLEKLLKKAEDLESFDKDASKVVNENIQNNLDWIKNYRGEIMTWLKENIKKSSAAAISVVPMLVLLGTIIRFVL